MASLAAAVFVVLVAVAPAGADERRAGERVKQAVLLGRAAVALAPGQRPPPGALVARSHPPNYHFGVAVSGATARGYRPGFAGEVGVVHKLPNGVVRLSTLELYRQGEPRVYVVPTRSRRPIAERERAALDQLGRGTFDRLRDNCEMFAREAVGERRWSRQARIARPVWPLARAVTALKRRAR